MYCVKLLRVGRLWPLLALLIFLYLALISHIQNIYNPLRSAPKQSALANVPPQTLYQFLNLNQEECKATFPDLTKDLDATLAQGPFTLKQAHGKGPLQARVKDGQALHAALHQINRALQTSPSPSEIPDTIFSLNVRDQPYGTAFSYSRPAYPAPASGLPPLTRAFLMPHFAFWNWPLPFIGSMARAEKAIAEIEDSVSFERKDPRVVWRGTVGFESVFWPTMRRDLVRATQGKDWADVRALDSYSYETDSETEMKGAEKGKGGEMASGKYGKFESRGKEEGGPGDAGNTTISRAVLAIEDFCRYKYVLYTDGVTYSGRLPFLQMCNSVLVAPPPAWRQLSSHLLRPVFSSDLLLSSTSTSTSPSTTSSTRDMEKIRKAWPERYTPEEEANAVFVAPDWSDLEDTIAYLEDHPHIARGIAKRQRDLFVGKGYASPAMETCYWRALLRGWSSVVRLEPGWEEEEVESVRWEEFSIL
ncbi:glycosyl transferase family 90-domain-containing protein [Xylaria arbuscula]|nr:glycosyl transferase family 90-domain-containing protein [Xylaria arbuscula]